MLKAGVPIAEAIETIQGQSANKEFKQILESITNDIVNGIPLDKAVQKFPKVFDPIYQNLVKTGNASGTLDQSLEYLTVQIERDHKFMQKIIAASLYPTIVSSVALIMSAYVSMFVLPKLVDLFKSMEIELPWTTKLLIGLAEIMKNYAVHIYGGLIIFLVLFKLFVNTKYIKYYWHLTLLTLPIMGNFIANAQRAEIFRNFGTMLHNGIPITTALEIVKKNASNLVFKRYLDNIEHAVTQGTALSDELSKKQYKYLGKMSVKMIGVGEKTGNLGESFMYLGDYFENEVDVTMANLSTIVEPILIIIIGAVVAFLAFAIISPVYQFTGSIKN